MILCSYQICCTNTRSPRPAWELFRRGLSDTLYTEPPHSPHSHNSENLFKTQFFICFDRVTGFGLFHQHTSPRGCHLTQNAINKSRHRVIKILTRQFRTNSVSISTSLHRMWYSFPKHPVQKVPVGTHRLIAFGRDF
jgi:hypothetical protein